MAAPINFESSLLLDQRRQERKQARETIIQNAKDKYEREERKKELKRQRGEDTWILPSVDKRIKEDSKKAKKHKKEKKKSKKHKKKHKKLSKESKSNASSSSDDDSPEEYEWVEEGTSGSQVAGRQTSQLSEKPDSPPAEVTKEPRTDESGDWLMGFGGLNTYTKGDLKKAKEEKNAQQQQEPSKAKNFLDHPGQTDRELNPFWKDGGTGMPSERDKPASTAPSRGRAGDGGADWLRRAYKRAQEQARHEGRPLEEIVAQRWGSMKKLQQMLEAAESREKRHGDHSRQDDNRRRDHRDHRERERDGRQYRDRDRDRDRDRPSRQNMKHDFLKPGEEEARGQRSHHAQRAGAAPSWKKKEFVETERRAKAEALELEIKEKRRAKMAAETAAGEGREASLEADSSGSADSSSSAESEEEEVQPLSEKEMNELGAKILRAELMGNTDQAAKLKAQLEAARSAKARPAASGSKGGEAVGRGSEEVVLTRTDHSGTSWPLLQSGAQPASTPGGGKRRKKRKTVETHGEPGERARYFGDDDKFDLRTLVQREKMSTAEDQNALYARLAGKSVEKTDDEHHTLDDLFVNRAAKQYSQAELDRRDYDRSVSAHKKQAASLSQCRLCFDNPALSKHMIIAIGAKAYLSLPANRSLTEGHCLIVPMQHSTATTVLDEDVWSEIKTFSNSLTKMFEALDQDVVFLELSYPKKFRHLFIECIPMPREVGELAPIYFKKALLESDTEWSHNKKVIDTRNKDIRRAVPRGLPYFSVEFGTQGGFAHVIEDEHLFPHYFGKEVVGGMIDAEPRLWRNPPKQSFEDQRQKVLHFADQWKQYDWTQAAAGKA